MLGVVPPYVCGGQKTTGEDVGGVCYLHPRPHPVTLGIKPRLQGWAEKAFTCWAVSPACVYLSYYTSHISEFNCVVLLLLVLSSISTNSVCLCSYHFYCFIFHPESLSLHLNVLFPLFANVSCQYFRECELLSAMLFPFIKETSSFHILWWNGCLSAKFVEPVWSGSMLLLKTQPKSILPSQCPVLMYY